jgi:integrase
MNEEILDEPKEGNSKNGYQKRGNKWSYSYSVKDPITKKMKQVRISGFQTKEEAKADRTRRELEAQEGKYVSKSIETIATFFPIWFKSKITKKQLKFSTIEQSRQTLETYIYPKIGHLALQDLNFEVLEDFLISLLQNGRKNGRGLSHSSIKKVSLVLSEALTYAVKCKKIAFNPMREVDKPKGQTKIIETFSAEEIKLLSGKANDHRLSAFFILACNTGARRGELLALRWSDFDLEKQTISISKTRGMTGGQIFENAPKTKNGYREIEITLDTISALLAHKERQGFEASSLGEAWQDTGYIFTQADGTPLYPTTPSWVFDKFVKELGLPKRPFLALRHTHATELLRMGKPAYQVAKRLGDEVATVLNNYAHAKPEDDRMLAHAFEDRIKSA